MAEAVPNNTRNSTARRKPLVRGRSIRCMQHVTRTAHGLDQRRSPREFELSPQLADMDVDHVAWLIGTIVPDLLKYHGARHDLAGLAHQIFQQFELARQ